MRPVEVPSAVFVSHGIVCCVGRRAMERIIGVDSSSRSPPAAVPSSSTPPPRVQTAPTPQSDPSQQQLQAARDVCAPGVRGDTPPKTRTAPSLATAQPGLVPVLVTRSEDATPEREPAPTPEPPDTLSNVPAASAPLPVVETNPWVELELERQQNEIRQLHDTVARLSRDCDLLSQGWQQRTSTSSGGKVYWYNTVTDTSSWTKPAVGPRTPRGRRRTSERRSSGSLLVQKDGSQSAAAAAAGGKTAKKGPARSVSFGEDKILELVVDSPKSARVSNGSTTPRGVAQQDETDPEDDLEDGWEVGVSETTGHKYYHHLATGKSQWDPPLKRSNSSKSGDSGEKGDGSSSLPEPWEERLSSSTQKAYYFNPITGESVWERPRSAAQEKTDNRSRRRGRSPDARRFACCAAPANSTPA